MTSASSWLDLPLNRTVRKRTVGAVGVELELEGSFKVPPEMPYWSSKEEHSLRGGLEFVLDRPLDLDELPKALAVLEGVLNVSKPKATIRCSTHLHINVLRKTNRELYSALGHYFLLEELLVRSQGPLRMGNLFCLRMSDAESISNDIVYSIQKRMGFDYFSIDRFKYGACNLAAVRRFGSVEFRFLRPLTPKMIDIWSNMMYNIIHRGSSLSLKDSLEMIDAGNYQGFLNRLLEPSERAILGSFTEDEIKTMIENNFDSVLSIQEALDKKEKFYIPEGQLEMESDTGPEVDSPYPPIPSTPPAGTLWDLSNIGQPTPETGFIDDISLDDSDFEDDYG